jgi:lipopolysaccharide transport system permease protein
MLSRVEKYLLDTWRYRFLIWHLVGSDLRARFRRSHLGILWAMIQPLMLALIFAFVLAQVFHQPFRDYALYIFSGMVAWDLLSSGLGYGSYAVINAEGYLRQSPIPLLVFQLRAMLYLGAISILGLLGFAAFCVVIAHEIITLYWLLFPVWLFFTSLLILPMIVISSTINLLVRDYAQAIGLFLQLWWYLSPVLLVKSVFSKEPLATWTSINPAAAVCDLFRDPLLYGRAPDLHSVIVMLLWTVGLSIVAVILQAQVERRVIFYF